MDVALCINFHGEGVVARRSARSGFLAVQAARESGADAGLVAVLDRADETTRHHVLSCGVEWDRVIETDCGDLGEARNEAARGLDTQYLSFGDGDDLTGVDWLIEAHRTALQQVDDNFVLHPEYVYYFAEWDFATQSPNASPSPGTASFFLRHEASTSADFDPRNLRFNNLFTSNAFVARSFLIRNPLPARCLAHGFGVEDWTWNALTVWAGVRHLVIPDTVHLVRLKKSGSLGAQNASLGLLPDLVAHRCSAVDAKLPFSQQQKSSR